MPSHHLSEKENIQASYLLHNTQIEYITNLCTNNFNCRHFENCANNFKFKPKSSPYKITNSYLNTLNTCLKWKLKHFYNEHNHYDNENDRNGSENLKRPLILNDYDKDMILHTCCEIL